MADALATFDDRGDLEEISRPINYTGKARFSGSNRHWGISPSLARAKPALAPNKRQPPAAATKPAPEEVVTLASLPPGTIYRIVLDLEGLREAFVDRIEDLDVPMTEIDAAGDLTRGNCQKLLCKSDAKWARAFGMRSLAKMLRGTGTALALIVDDEKFEPLKSQMVKRKVKRPWPAPEY